MRTISRFARLRDLRGRARPGPLCRLVAYLATGSIPPIGIAALAVMAAWVLLLAGLVAAATPSP